MQQQIEMEVVAREQRGKNAARRLRVAGSVPATVYGRGQDAQSISIDTKEMTNVLRDPAGHNCVFNIRCDGSQQHAMAVDYQIDPVTQALLHVDLLRVDIKKPVTVSVPVNPVGTAIGVKDDGGFEEMVSREVQIQCLPLEIPEGIDVDISDLHVGEAIRAKDIPASDQWTLADAGQKLLVHVMASRAVAEAAEEEAAEGAAEGVAGDAEENAG